MYPTIDIYGDILFNTFNTLLCTNSKKFWQFWAVLASFGQFWAVLGSFGQFWAVLGSFGQFFGHLGYFWKLPTSLE
jgi:hypothetical protein